jgi:hypothetical protein
MRKCVNTIFKFKYMFKYVMITIYLNIKYLDFKVLFKFNNSLF